MRKLNELTLLYIEDDNELREQFVRVLKPRFKKVYEAVDGLQALQMYEEHSIDVMLVDINLPKIDGLEVIERVRKDDKDTFIIVLSAYSDQEKLLKAIKLGLTEYLIKPVPYEKLLCVFDELVFKEKATILLQNGYSWKKEEKIFFHNDQIIPLTKRETVFIEFMIEQVNKVVTLNSIGNLIWENEDSSVAYSSLSHLLKRLKKKLPEKFIENIYGEGYRVSSGSLLK